MLWFNSHNNSDYDKAYGGATHFRNGEIDKELPIGEKGVLVLEL